jgi:prolyl-tRNA synthetase
MKFSEAFIFTAKEAPSDAVLASHIYLIRGGFIQSVGAGLYNFLPLGKKVLDKVRAIVKEELDKAGCQEVDLAFVTPSELWKESGRFEKYGKELLRFKDRKDAEYVLGPTHEEMMVNLVRSYVKSYKQLPINLYQIKTKFRDEIRPRFGLMRGREFLMKDGYSFHKDKADMVENGFNKMEQAYSNIFKRLGLDFRVVEADSGAIGGSGSKEFMALADSGEDTIVVCSGCEYGANIEAATRVPRKAPLVANEEDVVEMTFGKFHTPDIKSIEDLANFFHVDPYYTVKVVAKKALYDDGVEKIALFAIRGSDELQEVKACNSVDANDLVDIDDKELEDAGLQPGFMGIKDLPEDILLVVDNELKDGNNLICGANEKDYHFVGVNLMGEEYNYKDLVAVKEGDSCAKCGGILKYTKGIEVGHIFQLGTRYSEPLKAEFLDENGKLKPFEMGTYGIGVSRVLAAVIEQHHDDKGPIWTKATAPFDLEIIVSNIKKESELNSAFEIYNRLKENGIDVLIDDRKERFGFKMKDYELLGIPYAIIVGKKIEDGIVEIVNRATLEKEEIAFEKVIDRVGELIA